jgi:hypothetical protein
VEIGELGADGQEHDHAAVRLEGGPAGPVIEKLQDALPPGGAPFLMGQFAADEREAGMRGEGGGNALAVGCFGRRLDA